MAAGTWKPNGIVALLTDFGGVDPYVGIMKGVLLGRCPTLRAVVDLTHEVAPQDVRAGSFYLKHSRAYFGAGTVFMTVVDPGVGSARRILVAEDAGQVFLAPDNGLLGPVLGTGARLWVLDDERFALPNRSATFHGRDVFSPAAAALAGGMDPAACGQPAERWERLEFPEPRPDGAGGAELEVLVVDRFGNAITNGPAALVDADPAQFRLTVGSKELPVATTYASVRPGELLGLVDSYGLLEVACRNGDAAAALGLRPGSRVLLQRLASIPREHSS